MHKAWQIVMALQIFDPTFCPSWQSCTPQTAEEQSAAPLATTQEQHYCKRHLQKAKQAVQPDKSSGLACAVEGMACSGANKVMLLNLITTKLVFTITWICVQWL